MIQLPNGEQRDLRYAWDMNQTRIQCRNGEQWQGFTELFLQTKPERFRPRRKIPMKRSEAELKDETLQRELRKEMQQGLADKDMDFTPREPDS